MPSRANGDVSRSLTDSVVPGLTAVLCAHDYASLMTVLVLRKSVDDERVGGPFSCSDPNEIARVIGQLTIEERVAHLLETNETVTVSEDGIKVYRGDELTGYIVILSGE